MGTQGSSDGQFNTPIGITIDKNGTIYITELSNHRIQKFSSDGTFIAKWGTKGTGNEQFDAPFGIATDGNGNVYVSELNNHRIQKFTSDGTFITKWGTLGDADGQFNQPSGIALDTDGNVYIADCHNHRIQKFDSDGRFLAKWGNQDSGNERFYFPRGVRIDENGNIYIADTGNHGIKKFSPNFEFITSFGAFGSEPGLLNSPLDLTISRDGTVYVSDQYNHRIQVFKPVTSDPASAKSKAIIVAGGGPYAGNNLWDATQMCANFAYRALTYQGYPKDDIYYISHDTDLDLDGNGKPDDVDADATNANLQKAITQWAIDAKDVFIYMVDHGGQGTFRMREFELLQASDLDSWLDLLQQTLPGKLVMVYDACRSGSFISALTPPLGKERVIASSASSDQESLFAAQGSVSFSFIFWGNIFNGNRFYDSFALASQSIGLTYNQTPQLDVNGNGIANEKDDTTLAASIKIGNETLSAGDLPAIQTVSVSPYPLNGNTSATLIADNVIDADGISRVWAVITPPGYSSGSADNPVIDLPIVELKPVTGTSRYQGTYDRFNIPGAYNIAFFAKDSKGSLSLPKQLIVISEIKTLLAADFGQYGLYLYDGSTWQWIAGNPEDIAAWGAKLAADFGEYGIYVYENSAWNRIAGNSENITSFGNRLAADFGQYGLYLYDGANWQWISGNPENITSFGNRLAADFGEYGIYIYDGSTWNWIGGNPENIISFGNKLAADFGEYGLYLYDGSTWNWISGNPETMTAFGNKLAAIFGQYGIYVYDGNNWNWIAGNAETMTGWGNKLAADFGEYGLYIYDGANWLWIAGNAEEIAGL